MWVPLDHLQTPEIFMLQLPFWGQVEVEEGVASGLRFHALCAERCTASTKRMIILSTDKMH